MHPVFLFAGFFFFAIANNILGPLVTNIMAATGMSLSQSGSLVSFLQIGSLTSMLISLVLMKHVRQTTVTRIGYGVLIIGLLAIAVSTGSTLLFIAYLVIGFGAFLTDSGSNAILASDYYEKRKLYIPLLHFCYSLGAILTGYFILPFKGPTWRWAYGALGIILAVILIGGFLERYRRTKQQKLNNVSPVIIPEVQAEPVLPLLKDLAFVLFNLVIIFYAGSQIICVTWIPVYVETELFQPAAITATSLTVFWIGTAISRLLMGPIMQKGGNPFSFMLGGLLLAGFTLVALPFTANIVLALALVALCGFFAGATIPMYIVVTASWYPKNTAFISLSCILSATIGRMIFPLFVSQIAEAHNLGYALMISSLMLFIAAVLSAIVQKITKERPA
ncbi:MAG: MFS transporter [Sphaerochaetaceae bacterium]|nr:MFS transporter [Sphaerochaetaceae bacterium]